MPFSQGGAGFGYNGTQSQRLVQIGSNRTVADSDSGAAVFQQIRAGNGTFVASAAAGNTGSGVVGANSVTDPAAWAAGRPPYTISFTTPAAYTVTDSTGATVQSGAYTDGQTLAVNGTQLQLSGAPAAGDTFSVAASTNQDMFTTLQKLVTALTTSSAAGQPAAVNGINRAIEAIDQSLSNVSTVRSQVGARLNAIDTQTTTSSALSLQLNSTMSNLRDLDYAAAVTRLNQQITGLQAAQASYAKLQHLTLFNYL